MVVFWTRLFFLFASTLDALWNINSKIFFEYVSLKYSNIYVGNNFKIFHSSILIVPTWKIFTVTSYMREKYVGMYWMLCQRQLTKMSAQFIHGAEKVFGNLIFLGSIKLVLSFSYYQWNSSLCLVSSKIHMEVRKKGTNLNNWDTLILGKPIYT